MATVLPPLNEVPAATECLYSTVRNVTFNRMFFGFLPPHGKLLACGEELTVWGDIQDRMHKLTPQERFRRSYERALAGSAQTDTQTTNGVRWASALTKNQASNAFVTWDASGGRATPRALVLVKTPAVHLYDGSTHTTEILWLNNHVMYSIDPCWAWGDAAALTSTAITQGSCDVDSQTYLKDPRFVNSGYWHDMTTGHGRLTATERATTDTAYSAAGVSAAATGFPKI